MPQAGRRKRFIPKHFAEQIARNPFSHYVYFARNEANGLIKIGSTYGPRVEDRMWELGQMVGAPVTLLALTEGDAKLERTYHRLLAADRVYGEWFHPTERVLGVKRADTDPLIWTPDALAYWGEWANLL